MPEPVATDLYTVEDAEDHISDLRGQVDRFSEVISLNQTDVTPNTAAAQTQLYSDTTSGLLSIVSDSGAQGDLPWTKQSFFPGNAFTAASLTQFAAGTYPGNDAVAGAIYELESWGSGTQGSTRQTLQFQINLGGVAGNTITFGTTAFSAVSVGFRWWVKGRAVCNTTGVSGTWTTSIFCAVTDNGGGTPVSPSNNNMCIGFWCDAGSTITVDTTADQTVGLLAAWGATTGSPTGTSRSALFRRIC